MKFKYENVVRLAFQKKFYSKTRMDGHITIREKSVYNLRDHDLLTALITDLLNKRGQISLIAADSRGTE